MPAKQELLVLQERAPANTRLLLTALKYKQSMKEFLIRSAEGSSNCFDISISKFLRSKLQLHIVNKKCVTSAFPQLIIVELGI